MIKLTDRLLRTPEGLCLVVILVASLACLTLIMFVISRHNEIHRRGYSAWVKQTGNVKQLTYDEWYALSQTTRMWSEKGKRP